MVEEWTNSDYQSAGEWLATTPAGPLKNTAVGTYVEKISSYQPETAAQWATTLPPGQDRDQTFRVAYQNWPGNDAAAKDAFSKEHGIK